MTAENRISNRHVFQSRIVIRLRRNGQSISVGGWARDLSESGLSAFVAEPLEAGELVTLQIPLLTSGKELIPAKVTRCLGTEYGFEFTALSSAQRRSVRATLAGQPAIPHWTLSHRSHEKNKK